MTEQLIIDGVRIYAVMDRGNLWCMGRTTDKATFDGLALEAGLKVYTNPAQAAIIDPDTQEVLFPAVAASGPLIKAGGVEIVEIGPLTLVAGTYDDTGAELTAPVVDPRHHVNFWLGPEVLARGKWMQWSTLWTYYGSAIVANNAEDGTAMRGMELIDPATIASPSNRMQ
jgi:hypothetical protein